MHCEHVPHLTDFYDKVHDSIYFILNVTAPSAPHNMASRTGLVQCSVACGNITNFTVDPLGVVMVVRAGTGMHM